MLKASELINQSSEELEAQYEDICRDIFELANELHVSRKLEKPHALKEKKKDRARVLTVLRQKKSKGST
ncbi:MAG: 50S ribosomal protein L29 [Candidatus Neptunochlamydia sp.]|nr:50S ribosomal protein L29 [Candidatus Neptunochlamydia sp.]